MTIVTGGNQIVNLLEIRRRKRLTGAMISKQAEITQQYYSAIQVGKRRPSVKVAKRLGAVLGVDCTLFFEDSGQNARPPPD